MHSVRLEFYVLKYVRQCLDFHICELLGGNTVLVKIQPEHDLIKSSPCETWVKKKQRMRPPGKPSGKRKSSQARKMAATMRWENGLNCTVRQRLIADKRRTNRGCDSSLFIQMDRFWNWSVWYRWVLGVWLITCCGLYTENSAGFFSVENWERQTMLC